MEDSQDEQCLISTHQTLVESFQSFVRAPINPSVSVLNTAESSLFPRLPEPALGIQKTTNHLLQEIAPALDRSSLSANYYGFVTGGVSPAARVADGIVSFYDQNVHVHLPDQTVATTVEEIALVLLLDLLNLEKDNWLGRTFTTGATSSNVLGLACGREYIINQAIRRGGKKSRDEQFETVGGQGLLSACRAADIDNVQILTTLPHSSLKKASSIIGFGRTSVHDVGKANDFLAFDLERTETMLKRTNTASIVVISCGEVNTGLFATRSFRDVAVLRSLCDKYNAWMHVDAAFGLFARLLDSSPEFQHVWRGTEGLELADSITGDGHKLLNVSYDCGFFFCRHPDLSPQVFQNPNAAYLTAGSPAIHDMQHPLNVGLENSRRFRGLSVYATLIAYGRTGYRDMLHRQIRLARQTATYLFSHPAFELLPESINQLSDIQRDIYIIVLFRAKDDGLNESLVKRINRTSKIYISGTTWKGRPAGRMAVSNWQADPDADLKIIQSVFEDVLRDWRSGS
ncbi:hypothetical protein MMC07_003843 [Pseudocyphellaria aurata]|nr:hypothetical protein [Pseudocyphellaria aurata]